MTRSGSTLRTPADPEAGWRRSPTVIACAGRQATIWRIRQAKRARTGSRRTLPGHDQGELAGRGLRGQAGAAARQNKDIHDAEPVGTDRRADRLDDSGVGSLLAVRTVPADYGPVRSPLDLALGDPRLLELFFLDLLDLGYYIAPRGYMPLSPALTSAQLAAFVVAVQQIVRSRAAQWA
jgi:hypothetical protein